MALKEQILADIKSAMKSGEKDRLEAVRFLQAAVKNREIELRPKSIDDSEILVILQKLAKQRREGIEQFTQANRLDLVEKEKFELGVIEGYLPKQMNRADLEKLVSDVIAELKASSIKDMGGVMKQVMVKTAGSADNKVISEIVRSKLS
jgi:uncharacterized protein YqeY